MAQKYQVILDPRAEKELDKVLGKDFAKIDQEIVKLGSNPRPFGVKKLDGKLHRIRIGDWRVIYAILDDEQKLVVLHVARRNERTYKAK